MYPGPPRGGEPPSVLPEATGAPVIRPILSCGPGDSFGDSVILTTVLGYEFVQRGLLEVLLLSAGAGVLGTWAVMRGLAFYSHAVAAAAFPGLVLAAGLGFAPLLGAMGTGAVFALGVGRLSTDRRAGHDALTALATQLTSGMFSYHLISCPHLGLRERGRTPERSCGQRLTDTV